jgi:hypothetical protein
VKTSLGAACLADFELLCGVYVQRLVGFGATFGIGLFFSFIVRTPNKSLPLKLQQRQFFVIIGIPHICSTSMLKQSGVREREG